MELLVFHKDGIYCPRADVFIDPWRPVAKAIVTHAHADHARWGMKQYLAHRDSEAVMRLRLGQDISLQTLDYHEQIQINGVKISLHPAGHIIGSAQVRVAYNGEVWVVSGDYKTQPDGLTIPFEPVRCHTFITESTFGLPVYKWQPISETATALNQWWRQNQADGHTSILLGYSLGKAQTLIHHLDPQLGTIFTHGAVENTNEALRQQGVSLPATERVTRETDKSRFAGSMVVAPPSALGSSWLRKFAPYRTAMASGWMALRGAKRRRNTDHGFVISDHADWAGLNEAIRATTAERVFVTHGYSDLFSRWLCEQGLNAKPVATEYEGELSEMNETQVEE